MRMVNIDLQIKSLNHSITNNTILNDINLNLKDPQVVALLGPNGAGKSSLLKSLAAQFYPQKGHIQINGIDAESQRQEYLELIGYMPENATIIPELTVIEQLSLMAYLRGSKPVKTDLQSLINLCRLHKVKNKRTAQLSLGYKQRLNLAQALLNQPLVLIMDEPLNGLDPHLIIEFRNIIRELKKKTLILISTHYLAEAEIISDRVLIMQNGLMLDNIELNQSAFDLEQTYMQHTANNEQSL